MKYRLTVPLKVLTLKSRTTSQTFTREEGKGCEMTLVHKPRELHVIVATFGSPLQLPLQLDAGSKTWCLKKLQHLMQFYSLLLFIIINIISLTSFAIFIDAFIRFNKNLQFLFPQFNQSFLLFKLISKEPDNK